MLTSAIIDNLIGKGYRGIVAKPYFDKCFSQDAIAVWGISPITGNFIMLDTYNQHGESIDFPF